MATIKKPVKKIINQVAPAIHRIDATEQVLGRLACQVSILLRGKDKPGYQYHIDQKSGVIITNAAKIKLTGKKINQKVYYHHSGYPGGLKETKMMMVFGKNPALALKKAVWNMLPKNKMRSVIIKRLKITN